MNGATRRMLYHLLRDVWQLDRATSGLAADRLVAGLDSVGLVLMPIEPSNHLIGASLRAMRQLRWIDGPPEKVQEIKHLIRYRAMVERQRQFLGLVANEPRDNEGGAVHRTREALKRGALGGHDDADDASLLTAAEVVEDVARAWLEAKAKEWEAGNDD